MSIRNASLYFPETSLSDSFFFKTLAHAKHVAVRVPQVHFTYIPGHVGRRESYIQRGGHTLSVYRVNIVHPYRHPRALVRDLVAIFAKRRGVSASPAATLAVKTQEDFISARPHCSE